MPHHSHILTLSCSPIPQSDPSTMSLRLTRELHGTLMPYIKKAWGCLWVLKQYLQGCHQDGIPLFGEGDHGAFLPSMLDGNIQDIARSVYSSPIKMKVPPLILIALVEPWYTSPGYLQLRNQRWVLDYALGYQTFGGLPWTSLFWPRLHTYPPLQWGLEGRQLYLYRLGLKNRVSILESTWGSFSRKTYGYWVLKQKNKNRCPLQPSLTTFIFLSRVMTLILQYLKLMVTQRRQIPWSPRERDKRWEGAQGGEHEEVRSGGGL